MGQGQRSLKGYPAADPVSLATGVLRGVGGGGGGVKSVESVHVQHVARRLVNIM